ncbi:MAG: hypothetical protein AB7T38_06390 [Nitrospirales bacterium]
MQPQTWLKVVNHSWKLSLFLGLMSCALGLIQPGCSNGAMIEPGSEKSLAQRVTEAELIYSGTVEKVEYGLSDGMTDSEGALPYTYVTYRIDQTLKGSSANGTSLTLRFLGGQTSDGRFFEASNIPQFQVNDRDLLFVENNGETDCPLVDCQSGRFRILKKGMYADDGRPVVGINTGHFIYDNRLKSSSAPLTLERVKKAILKEVTRLYTPQQLQALEPVQSAERGDTGNLSRQPDDLAPGVPLSPEEGPGSASEGDRLESEAFERNRGNPVLNEKK